MKKTNRTRTLCESALLVALSLVLSYLKIPIGVSFGGFGGSIDFVMVPLILIALRHGTGWGLGAGLVFGTLKYFFASGFALNWASMLLDYSVAYAFVGFSGLVRKNSAAAALVGCLARFIVHFFSGVTIYAAWMPESFLGMTMTNAAVYSVLYNGTYMLPNTVIAVILVPIIHRALTRIGAKK